MRKFSWMVATVAVLGMALAGLTQAAIIVNTDSGNVGAFTFTNTGIAAGTATILVGVPDAASAMNTVNGAVITAEPASVNVPFNLLVTPTVPGEYTLAISPNTAVKTIGNIPGAQALLPFTLNRGDTPAALPNFFNASGLVTGVTSNLNPTYDFSQFSGGGTINFTFTATAFTGTSSFAGLFTTVGATAIGNGSFSQQAVPEPPSIVMWGTTLVGLALIKATHHWRNK